MTAEPAEDSEPQPEVAAEEAAPQTPTWTAAEPRAQLSWNLTSVTAISFSLTFVLMSVALLAGVMPQSFAALPMPVDLGVLLLMVPLCALVLAIMAEALRAAMQGVPSGKARRTATALSQWRPGHGEG
jgi:uncharacterized membrane protein YidH (DUF202 family)